MGGALLQHCNRDTFRYAMKNNAVMYENATSWKYVQKNPKTQPEKASKAGRQAVVIRDGEYVSIVEDTLSKEENILREVYNNGKLLVDDTFSVIRERAKI